MGDGLASPIVRMGLLALGLAAEISTGIWIRSTGRPFPIVPFTIHKLVTVGLLVLLVVLAVKVNKATGLTPLAWVAIVAACLALLAATATGGWIAASESHPPVLATLHKWIPFVAVPLVAAAFYLLFRTPTQG